MPNRRFAATSLLVLGATGGLLAAVLASEGPAGAVAGRVRDRAGNPLPGAHLRFESEDGLHRAAVAGPRGDFRVNLPEGAYHSMAASEAFMPARTTKPVRVAPGEPARLLFALAVPGDLGASSTVTVVGGTAEIAARPTVVLEWTPGWPRVPPGMVAGTWVLRESGGDPLPG
ncbi:MAG: carboxypeptidase regulatory-like domain-containing protein, partial [Candidatus Sericytochromatia bacterium]|nr:carboxypeptidase regulatory-like domain-containing protein [Candidatus Tanganyikabacteria bacterium]